MKYFVTGANGFIGQRLCSELAARGDNVIAFCRNATTAQHLSSCSSITVVKGDVCRPESLNAIQDADAVFHLAALAKPWSKDRAEFDRVNLDGTLNVARAAVRHGLKKLVFTSTAGVFGSVEGGLFDERSSQSEIGKTDYEISKQRAEHELRGFCESSGLEFCVVHPTRVFGPGLFSPSNALTMLIKRFIERRIQFIPRFGDALGNYVFVDDVVDGHLRAMDAGGNGHGYILSGTNLTTIELAKEVNAVVGGNRVILPIPQPAIWTIAWAQLFWAQVTGRAPRLTPAFVRKYSRPSVFCCDRAKNKLGYKPTEIAIALEKTVRWLRSGKNG